MLLLLMAHEEQKVVQNGLLVQEKRIAECKSMDNNITCA